MTPSFLDGCVELNVRHRNNEPGSRKRKQPEQGRDDLSIQYREIGIKVFAAAATHDAGKCGSGRGNEEGKKQPKEKASG
jgi:hypothetical protein